MQATMSPVPISMLPHSAGAQTAIATRNAVPNLVAPLLRRPLSPSLHAPAPQRLVRHATAPEPRAYTPHPSGNKRKASFHELSPEVAERPSKRPKIEQDNSDPEPNPTEKVQKNASRRASPQVPTPEEMPLAPPEPPVKSASLLYLEAQRAKLLPTAAIPKFIKRDKLAGRLRWEQAHCDILVHPRRTGRATRPQLPSPLSGVPRVPGTWSSPAIALPHPHQDTSQIRCSAILHNARTRKNLVYDPTEPRTTMPARLARWTMFPQGKNVTPDLRRACTLLAFGVEGGGYMKSAGVRAAWIKHEAMYGRAKECDEDAETEVLTEILDNGSSGDANNNGSALRRPPPMPFEEGDRNNLFTLRRGSRRVWPVEVDESGDVIMSP